MKQRIFLPVIAVSFLLGIAGCQFFPDYVEGVSSSISTRVSVSSISLDSNLVAYYPFDGNPNDASGHGNNGSVLSNAVLTTDRFGNLNSAYHFNNNGCIVIPDSPDLRTDSNSMATLMLWVKADTITADIFYYVIGKGDPNKKKYSYSFCQYNHVMGNGPVYAFFQVIDGFVDMHLDDTNTNIAGGWHFLVATKNKLDYSFYLDGKLMESDTWTNGDMMNADPLYIGYIGYCSGIIGSVDDVRFFKRALDISEISNYYLEMK